MIKVTGASGFVGRTVLDYCKTHGIEALGYTRGSATDQLVSVKSYAEIPEGGSLIHLGEHSHIATLTEEIAAEQIGVAQSLPNKKFDRIVYASSAAIFNSSEEAIKTSSTDYADSLYSKTKRINEDLFTQKGHLVARLSNVYGPYMSKDNLFRTIFKQKDQSVIEVLNTKPVRDYIWSMDAVEALIKLSQSSFSGAFHVSTGIGTSVEDLIKMICKLSGNTNYSIVETSKPSFSKIVLDPSETKEQLNWQPRRDMVNGLSRLIEET